ncbi:hypothetical protein T11_9316 [Trichinella zimbabwensis]|uniref:Uncharacterized protein n=1 Tax=Trichinella zimbabwensis TaxID=268475 RepID=A0A0V1GME1_9BILA|nr:hypothetical protein T11_9316 [Trichinella zimbabwensis]
MTNRVVTECQLYNLKYNGLNNTKNTLQHSLIYRYVTHHGRKPSKTITIKTFRKPFFTQNAKTEKAIATKFQNF